MRQLLRTVDDDPNLSVIVPPPGKDRHLKRAGTTDFDYPVGCIPPRGPVVVTHRANGEIVLWVRPSPNPRLTGRAAELFRTGCLSFTASDAVADFLCGELMQQWEGLPLAGEGTGEAGTAAAPDEPRRAPVPTVDGAAVSALRQRGAAPFTANGLAERISARVVGQEPGVQRLSAGVALHLRKVSPTAPYSVLLIGPTGVGKTEVALRLSEALLSAEPDRNWSLVTIDCGEITGEDQLNRIIGAAPGFVGFQQGSPIADALADGPALLVFDEIEKAHPALLNHVLLGLLDRGRFSVPNAGRGAERVADARTSVVLFTSNLAVGELVRGMDQGTLRSHLRSHGLRPELVGRLRDVVQFEQLDDDSLIRAACIATQDALEEYGLEPRTISPAFLARCLDEHDQRSGVRGVRVIIERLLGPSLEELVDRRYSGAVVVGSDADDQLRPVA